uniref:DDHD domain-containing protein n=1 Tax=Micrurus lemniscatus lemniscatus TaxID=129467 RepID=A0A2D4HIF1_MICLE
MPLNSATSSLIPPTPFQTLSQCEESEVQHRSRGQFFCSNGFVSCLVELDHRIDFELREGLVESRYWSAVTSHTAYWSSMDVALFLLTFMYKQDQEEDDIKPHLDPV